MRKLGVEEIQDELFDALIKIDAILQENNIAYFMGFGTLLGAVRHKGFIPWDDDLDIVIPRNELERAKEVLSKHLPRHYSVINVKNGNLPWDVDLRVRDNRTLLDDEAGTSDSGIYVDIIEMPEIAKRNRLNYVRLKKLKRSVFSSSNSILKRCVSFFSYSAVWVVFSIIELFSSERYLIVSDKLSGGMYTPQDIYPLRELSFRDRSYYAPNDHKKILMEMYGDYMQIPPESERKQHFQQCYLKT